MALEEILVTGMEGMDGAHIAKAAIARGIQVVGTKYPTASRANLDALDPKGCATVVDCDLTNRSDVKNLFAQTKPDAIIHLAGITSNRDSSQDTFAINTQMFEYVIEEAGYMNAPRIILASTALAYGRCGSRPFDERSPLVESSPYINSKIYQERRLMEELEFGFEGIIVRPSQHTGIGRMPGSVESDIAEQIIKMERGLGPSEIRLRNAAAEVDMFDARDAALAYLALAADGENGEVYNLCSGRGIRNRELARAMIKISKRRGDENLIPIVSTDLETPVPARYSNAKIVQWGWEPQYELAETLEYFLDWKRSVTP